MVKFLSRHSKWIIAGFGFLAFGLTQTHWLTSSELWQKAEGALIDRRYLLRGESPPDPDIKLVGVENSSFQLDALSTNEIAASPTLQLMQHPPPWDRKIYSAILEKLMNSGAKVVLFDFAFTPVTDGDADFARTLLKYKDRVVIGEYFSEEEGPGGELIRKLNTPNKSVLLPGTESIAGLVNLWPDPDGIFRRGKYQTSIEREAGLRGYQDDLTHITVMAVKKFTGKTILPPNQPANYVDFQGRAGTYGPLPVENMFVDSLWKGGGRGFNGGMIFSNKIVIVGPIAEIYHDIHATPFGAMSGPEVQAQMIAALLQGSWLMGTLSLTDAAIALVMMWLALGICLRINNAPLKVALLVAAVVVFFVVCQIAFSHKLVLPMMQPLFCLAVPGAFGVVFQYALEQFERIRTRSLLERYVSKNVAKTILDDQRSFIESLRGRKQSVTVLFSDIRGFTGLAESSDAEKLVAQLNEYFLEMVGIVLKEGGTLQKFIGDAIMSAWGDTRSEGLAEDARRAVNAALQMRTALVKLNEQWAAQPDRTKLNIGIGVNHGEIIVGNIGHPQRMEFTVLGDGVNLASRLENATRQFHTDILVGETVEALTRDKFIYRNVGAVAFKGKTKPVEVFTLLSDCSQPAPAWLAKYHEAVKRYRERQFAEAASRFEAVGKEIGGGDFLCEMYQERCRACLGQPPPADWDGYFTLTEK